MDRCESCGSTNIERYTPRVIIAGFMYEDCYYSGDTVSFKTDKIGAQNILDQYKSREEILFSIEQGRMFKGKISQILETGNMGDVFHLKIKIWRGC